MEKFQSLHKNRLVREIENIGSLPEDKIIKNLVDFQSINKYLLFTFNQSEKDKMGALLGNLPKIYQIEK